MNKVALKEGEIVSRDSIVHLLILGLIKLAAGLFTGMSVMIADAIATFADTLGLFASYLGLRLSRKSADKKFEYGYYKIETFAALLVSIGTMYAGYIITKGAIERIGIVEIGVHRPFAITATILAIIHSYRLWKKLTKTGKKVNSLSLLANANDKKMDMFAGVIVLISIVANYEQIPYVESIVTIGIGLIILRAGYISAKESLFFLLDFWDDPVLIQKIRKIFREEKDIIIKVNKIRLRRAGTFIFGEAFVELNPYAGLSDLRESLELLKQKIEDSNPYIKDFPIYTHIAKTETVKVAIPIKSGRSLKSPVANSLKETKAYIFVSIYRGKVRDYKVKTLKSEDKGQVELAEFLKKEKAKIIIDNKLNSLIYYNLRRTHHLLIYPNFKDVKTAGETIKLLMLDV